MKAGKASTTPLPIDFKKLRAFSKFSKVFNQFMKAQNIVGDIHRLAGPREANPRAGNTFQANRYELRRVHYSVRAENSLGQPKLGHNVA
jgi:hypothetical protein